MAVLGLAGPAGVAAAAFGGSAAAVAPTVSTVAANAGPVLYHQPLLGKDVLSLPFGLSRTADVQSSNWAGYADIDDTYETASVSWIQPSVNCSSNTGGGGGLSSLLGGLLGGGASGTEYSSFWVGLDGYTSSSVEQAGTDSDCDGTTPTYYAWYEMYPAGSTDISTTSYPVAPGDQLNAMVMSNAAGTSFDLMLSDGAISSPKWTFSITLSGSGLSRSSAEFVAEAPSSCTLIFCNELPLANFGSVTFTNAHAADTAGVSGNIDAFSNAAMTMASGGSTKATPTPSANPGPTFSVTWDNS
ncbi:MAG TPA: G1 family glutamic endopeptidase [Acidimicrobiales bacterium]|jgi:hypothetical protein